MAESSPVAASGVPLGTKLAIGVVLVLVLGMFAFWATQPNTVGVPEPLGTKVHFVTTQGEFTIQLLESYAPATCKFFKQLVNDSFYDGGSFYRSESKFFIQGGGVCYIIFYKYHIEEDEITQSLNSFNIPRNSAETRWKQTN